MNRDLVPDDPQLAYQWLREQRPSMKAALGARYGLLLIPRMHPYREYERALLYCLRLVLSIGVRAVSDNRELEEICERASHNIVQHFALTQDTYGAEPFVGLLGGQPDYHTPFMEGIASEAEAWNEDDPKAIFGRAPRTFAFENWERHWVQLKEFFDQSDLTWGFWARWYEGMLNGTPMSWELQRLVATEISDEVWEAGAEAVADEIRKLQLLHVTAAMQQLVHDEVAGVFHVAEEQLAPPEVAEFSCKRVEIALNAALKTVSHNVFNDHSYEAVVINETLALDDKSVSVLALGFYDACLGLNRNIGDRYPEDVALTNLKNALWGVTEELCELDDKAKERCALLAGFNPAKSVEDLPREDLLAIPDVVGGEVDDKARKMIESDVERALSKDKPPTRAVRMRLTNWLTEISVWMDATMKADKRAKWLAGVVDRLRKWLED